MSKFQAGDKVKVVSCERKSYWYSDLVGKEFILLGVDKSFGPYIQENEHFGRSFFSECDIELVCANKPLVQEKEQMKSEAFNLKTNPWFIRVNNKEEYEAAKAWVKSQGVKFKFSEDWYKGVVAIGTDRIGLCIRMEAGEKILNNNEIKLTFKTVVDSVEYPQVKSERDLKIEELEQSIKEAQERLNELKRLNKCSLALTHL